MQARRLSRRRLTSWWVVVSLLFSQLALASYVCPSLSAAERMSARMAAGMPCDGDDESSTPVLCHQHATNAAQSFEMAKVAALSLPAIVQMLVLPALHDPAHSVTVAAADRPEARPPPDPVFLETLRLRV